ncbi:MAG: AsmA family protein [Leptospiraceae bacterium]|nr:AsmA family protein [Leptospiraceae bacterium]MCZ8345925.1 AsmA family protein [Leptospiraceae bacterium]
MRVHHSIFKYTKKIFIGIAFLILFLISSVLILVYSIPYMMDLEEYKKLIFKEIQERTELKIEFSDSDIEIFPIPGISFKYINLSKDGDVVASMNQVFIQVAIIPLLSGKVDLTGVYLNSGSISILRNKDGSFPIFTQIEILENVNSLDPLHLNDETKNDNQNRIESKDEKVKKNQDKVDHQKDSINSTNEEFVLSAFLADLPDYFELENIHIKYNNGVNGKLYHFYIWKSKLEIHATSRSFHLDLFGKMNEEKLEIYSDFSFEDEQMTYENFRIKSSIFLTQFSASIAEDILVIFPRANFKFSSLTGKIHLTKDDEDLVKLHLFDARILNLSYKQEKSFGNFIGGLWIYYSYKENKLSLDDIQVEWIGKSKVYGNGILTFGRLPIIYFSINSNFFDYESISQVVNLWLDADLDKSKAFKGIPDTGYKSKVNITLDWNLENISYYQYKINSISGKTIYKNGTLLLSGIRTKYYGGEILSDGQLNYSNGLFKLNSNHTIQNINMEELLNNYSDKKYLSGEFSGNFVLSSRFTDLNSFESNLYINGDYLLQDGELMGYLNFFRPIASIGKFINFNGPTRNSMEYSTIRGNLLYEKKVTNLTNIKMRGIGLDAEANGKLSADKINMRVTVSLPGPAGKAIKLPILYQGVFGKNVPFVDPVWLGSVYVGTILLAGPAGAAVGGIAGSAASEYVNSAISNIQKGFKSTTKFLFGSSSEEKSDEVENKNDPLLPK